MKKVFKSGKMEKSILSSYDELLKLWAVDFTEKDIDTEYGVTHCIFAGDSSNPPLLMFHGVGDNSAIMWVLNIKSLSEGFYCIAIDTLGGPGKSIPNENYVKGVFDQVSWISQIIDALLLNKPYMIGVSNGAYMVFNYMTHHIDKVKKAVCLEGGMIISDPIKTMIKTLAIMFPQILIPTKKNMIAIMKKMTYPESEFFIKHANLIDCLILIMKGHKQSAMFAHKLERYDKEKGMLLSDKLLFLFGDYMIVNKKEFIDILQKDGFEYKVICGAGHGINLEKPDEVNTEIKNFLC